MEILEKIGIKNEEINHVILWYKEETDKLMEKIDRSDIEAVVECGGEAFLSMFKKIEGKIKFGGEASEKFQKIIIALAIGEIMGKLSHAKMKARMLMMADDNKNSDLAEMLSEILNK